MRPRGGQHGKSRAKESRERAWKVENTRKKEAQREGEYTSGSEGTECIEQKEREGREVEGE